VVLVLIGIGIGGGGRYSPGMEQTNDAERLRERKPRLGWAIFISSNASRHPRHYFYWFWPQPAWLGSSILSAVPYSVLYGGILLNARTHAGKLSGTTVASHPIFSRDFSRGRGIHPIGD
jgi:hypothetical protein